ncbi:MAG: hypothetical protein RL095_3072 [Verrucomicrobiota bacterium]|jgi:hemerythrin
MDESGNINPDDYQLGQALIDREHAELIRLINALKNETLSSGEVLRRLQTYVQEHFEGEEELMLLSAYPEADEHFSQHREFSRHLAGFAIQIHEAPQTMPEVRHFLEQWLLHHIQVTDRRLVDFLLHEEWL